MRTECSDLLENFTGCKSKKSDICRSLKTSPLLTSTVLQTITTFSESGSGRKKESVTVFGDDVPRAKCSVWAQIKPATLGAFGRNRSIQQIGSVISQSLIIYEEAPGCSLSVLLIHSLAAWWSWCQISIGTVSAQAANTFKLLKSYPPQEIRWNGPAAAAFLLRVIKCYFPCHCRRPPPLSLSCAAVEILFGCELHNAPNGDASLSASR